MRFREPRSGASTWPWGAHAQGLALLICWVSTHHPSQGHIPQCPAGTSQAGDNGRGCGLWDCHGTSVQDLHLSHGLSWHQPNQPANVPGQGGREAEHGRAAPEHSQQQQKGRRSLLPMSRCAGIACGGNEGCEREESRAVGERSSPGGADGTIPPRPNHI